MPLHHCPICQRQSATKREDDGWLECHECGYSSSANGRYKFFMCNPKDDARMRMSTLLDAARKGGSDTLSSNPDHYAPIKPTPNLWVPLIIAAIIVAFAFLISGCSTQLTYCTSQTYGACGPQSISEADAFAAARPVGQWRHMLRQEPGAPGYPYSFLAWDGAGIEVGFPGDIQ